LIVADIKESDFIANIILMKFVTTFFQIAGNI